MKRRRIDVAALSPQERLDLLEEIWDSLAASPDVLPLVNAQRTELDRRLDEIDRDHALGIPWDQVLDQIRRSM